ncbi:lectin-like domain-containing protein [Gardnerella pickettii]|uniref:lectin-like domain-containing protein n=1 Tax=Gardnerella pickettii TaxID=2914924 RepID=UPI0039F1312D
MKVKKATVLLMATLVPFGVMAGTTQAFAAGGNVTSEYGQQSENMIEGTNTLTDVVKNAGKDVKTDGKLYNEGVGSGIVVDSEGKSDSDTSSSTKATSQAVNAVAKNEVNKGDAGSRKRAKRDVSPAESQSGKVTITKDNFLDYFRVNGSATYDSNDGIVTITPEAMAQSGNFSLKSKINMGQSFKLIGKVNLGSKTKDGADGIGFAFHTGNTTDVGAGGGNLGIGGLRNATGFKLDTFFNARVLPAGDRFDVSKPGFQYGWDDDPRDLGQFGAWVDTTYKKVKGQDSSLEYDRWWAETDSSSAQKLDPSDLDGKFHDFTIEYNGISKKLKITYTSNAGIKTWEKTVSTPEKIMSMVVTASTGNYTNLQQFQIESFNIYQSASVDVRYVDEQDRDIAEGSVTYPDGAFKGKTYKTEKKEISGYDFIKMKEGSLPASGTLNDWGTNGTVTYVYRQGVDKITDQAKLNKTVTRTIKYVYADGKTEGRPTLKATVTQEAKFTRTGERNRVTGKETFSAWTPANNELAKEDTPVVKGFLADKVNVAAKTVTADDKNIEEIVTYKKLENPNPPAPNPNPVPQTKKRIGGIPKTGDSTSFAGLLVAIGSSIAGLAILRKKKMMEENKNK